MKKPEAIEIIIEKGNESKATTLVKKAVVKFLIAQDIYPEGIIDEYTFKYKDLQLRVDLAAFIPERLIPKEVIGCQHEQYIHWKEDFKFHKSLCVEIGQLNINKFANHEKIPMLTNCFGGVFWIPKREDHHYLVDYSGYREQRLTLKDFPAYYLGSFEIDSFFENSEDLQYCKDYGFGNDKIRALFYSRLVLTPNKIIFLPEYIPKDLKKGVDLNGVE